MAKKDSKTIEKKQTKAAKPKAAKVVSSAQELTHKQALFVKEYLVDLNATQAAIRAGYSESTARIIGAQNLSKLNIQSAIQKAMQERGNKTEITAERVLLEAARLAFYDIRKLCNADGSPKNIHELDDDTAAAIVGIDIVESGGEEPQITKKFKLADKNNAIERLFKHLGLYQLDNSQKIDPLTTLLHSIASRSGNAFTPVEEDNAE